MPIRNFCVPKKGAFVQIPRTLPPPPLAFYYVDYSMSLRQAALFHPPYFSCRPTIYICVVLFHSKFAIMGLYFQIG